jgi:general secretion pathway protein A
MTPDPAMLYMTPSHREALAGLTYAIVRQKGFIVLTGEVGTGKTTLVGRVLQHLPQDRVKCSVIVNPKLTCREFLEMALAGWGVAQPPESKTQRLLLLRSLLLAAKSEGIFVVLVVDEAHALSAKLLEEIRLLGNFEEAEQKLLQIVLAGQSELTDLLNREDLRQIKQRIAVRLNIERLSEREVDGYIRYRWIKAGGQEPPFSSEAVSELARFSRGIPRVINAICSNALMVMAAEGASCIGPEQIRDVCADLNIVPAPPSAPAAPVSIVPANLAARAPVKEPAPALIAPPAPEAEWAYPLKSLERYAPAKRTSFLGRWAGKLWA